ncbi:MAG: class I SAM-dependent methyltransferase [Actinobacteria bacterium]|nr:class I SAM-dependent methyltransferase [Actinomycetota bacterium]
MARASYTIGAMDDRISLESAELAAIYDAIYADRDDAGFWQAMAAATGDGPILELGCGTGRVLLPLARAGHEITGLDLSAEMLERCGAKLQSEPPEVRGCVRLLQADMTSFDLGRRFAALICPFAGFQQLRTVEQQLATLERCRTHLLPHGRLVLDLPNPDPAPAEYSREAPGDGESTAELVEWTDGRRIRWWMTVIGYDRLQQVNECEVTYEVIESGGASRRLTETISLRYTFRYELEHLLVRAGFRIVALYGDYDRSPLADESPALIVVAEALGA